MRTIKSYITDNRLYKGHLCNDVSLWLFDSEGSLFSWKLPDKEEVSTSKKYYKLMGESPIEVNSVPVLKLTGGELKDVKAIDEKCFFAIYEKLVYVVVGGKGEAKSFSGDKLMTGDVVDKDKVLLINESLCLYYVLVNDLINPSVASIVPCSTIMLKGNIGECCVLYSPIEKTVMAVSKIKQVFFYWNLNKGSVTCMVDKPWKKVLKGEDLIFKEKEKVTASLIYSNEEYYPPLLIIATNKGNVFIFNMLMSNSKTKTLKVTIDHKEPINCMCIKERKVIAGTVTGSLTIIDISSNKLQSAYEKSKDNLHKVKIIIKPLTHDGVADFLPIHNLSELDKEEVAGGFELVEEVTQVRTKNSFCEKHIGVIGNDNRIVLVSISFFYVTHEFQCCSSKPIGLYLSDATNSLIVLTKNMNAYVYSLASKVLERRLTTERICRVLNVNERLKRHLSKKELSFEDLFTMHSGDEMKLKKGSNKVLNFYNYMESIQLNWKKIETNKEPVYQMICNEFLKSRTINELWLDKKAQLKLFNLVSNLMCKVNGKFDEIEDIGFTSIRAKIGSRDNRLKDEAKRVNNSFKGKFSDANKSNIIIIDIKDLLKSLRKKYKIETEDNIEEEKNVNNILIDKSMWPFPLLSLMHCFGVNKSLDKELSEEFNINPLSFQVWIGVPGFGEALSFAIPTNLAHKEVNKITNWTVSPYLNSMQCMMLLSSFTSIIKVKEHLIMKILHKLLKTIGTLLRTHKELPYVSFMKIGSFIQGLKDLDSWSTARYIVLRPLLKEARSFMNMTKQASSFMDALYEKAVKDENFGKALDFLISDDTRMNFNFSNTYITEVELRIITILCYTFTEHGELAASERVVKRLLYFICSVIW